MVLDPHSYEKLVSTRHAQIRHDMQQSRPQAHSEQKQTFAQQTINGLGTLLIEMGSQLQKSGQRREASLRSS